MITASDRIMSPDVAFLVLLRATRPSFHAQRSSSARRGAIIDHMSGPEAIHALESRTRKVRTLARSDGVGGEVALRRRTGEHGTVDELIVNGAFAMDSAEVSTELALARIGARTAGRVLVGGLGLGFTVGELLRSDVRAIDVVELEACLIDWARAGVTDLLGQVAEDPRTRLYVADVADVLIGAPGCPIPPDQQWDAILLDVDNGPDFLIHDANARIYGADLLGAAARRLAPGGTLAVWCQGPAPELAETLRNIGGRAVRVDSQLIEVLRDGRWLTYAIYTLIR
jgi:spermidine synthase